MYFLSINARLSRIGDKAEVCVLSESMNAVEDAGQET